MPVERLELQGTNGLGEILRYAQNDNVSGRRGAEGAGMANLRCEISKGAGIGRMRAEPG